MNELDFVLFFFIFVSAPPHGYAKRRIRMLHTLHLIALVSRHIWINGYCYTYSFIHIRSYFAVRVFFFISTSLISFLSRSMRERCDSLNCVSQCIRNIHFDCVVCVWFHTNECGYLRFSRYRYHIFIVYWLGFYLFSLSLSPSRSRYFMNGRTNARRARPINWCGYSDVYSSCCIKHNVTITFPLPRCLTIECA